MCLKTACMVVDVMFRKLSSEVRTLRETNHRADVLISSLPEGASLALHFYETLQSTSKACTGLM